MVGKTVELSIPLVDYRQHDANLFGVPGRRASHFTLPERSARYVASTKQMRTIVESLSVDSSVFPLFNRSASLEYLERAIAYLEARDEIYCESRPLGAAGKLLAHARMGRYRRIHDNAVRWRSIARDLKFVVRQA
jgi:hypothetical protein